MNKHHRADEDLYDPQYEDMDSDQPEFQDDEPTPPTRDRKWLTVMVSFGLALVLLANGLAFFPQWFNLDVVKFLAKSNELSQRADIQQYKQAIVIVRAGNNKGTGFHVVNPNDLDEYGYILTNAHVIEGFTAVEVYGLDGDSYPAEVVVKDEIHDVAVLHIKDATVVPLERLSLVTQLEIIEGQPIKVIGNPLVFNGIANEGFVGRNIQLVGSDQQVMSVQAPIYRGNSGSPVIAEDGKVVGMIFATSQIVENGTSIKVGLAIPSSIIETLMSQLP